MTRNIVIDETNIEDVIKAFEYLLQNIEKYATESEEKIIKESKNYLDKQYSKRLKDDNISDISTRYEKIDDGYKLIAEGPDVIYEEFGTGDKGQDSPHPDKSKYNLDDYNSGITIRSVNKLSPEKKEEHGLTSGKYWTYKKDESGEVKYTQGVPAGKEMWNTRNYMINTIIPKANKELGAKLCEEFERSIKK